MLGIPRATSLFVYILAYSWNQRLPGTELLVFKSLWYLD